MNTLPEPFKASVDMHSDDHCSRRATRYIYGLVGQLSPRFTGTNRATAYALAITMLADGTIEDPSVATTPRRLTEEQAFMLERARDYLVPCAGGQCKCAVAVVDADLDVINNHLNSCGDHLWVVTKDGNDATLYGGVLSTTDLWDGFSELSGEYVAAMEASYDGTSIDFVCTGTRGTYSQLTFTPLPDVYYEAAKAMYPNGEYDSAIMELSEDVLTIVVSLYREDFKLSIAERLGSFRGYPSGKASFESLLKVADRLEVSALDGGAMLAARALAPGWSSSFTELIAAARASCAIPALA